MDFDKKFIESLGFLSQTSQISNQPLQEGELISLILEESIKLSGAELITLVMYEWGGALQQIYIMIADSQKKLAVSPNDLSFEDKHIEMLMPHQINPEDPWNSYFKRSLDRQFACKLRIPLFFKEKWSGYLDFYASQYPFFTDENLVEALQAVADHFSLTLENAELKGLLRRKTLENRLLIETSQMLANVLEQDDVLGAIAEALKRVVDYDSVSIYLVGEGSNLDAIFWKGYDDPECRDLLMARTSEGLVGWAARTGKGAVVGDVTEDPRYICARTATRSELVVPIKLKDKVIGVFNIESDHPGAYTRHDLDLLMTFAAKSALAIERATLYKELVSKKQLDQEVAIARSIQKTFLPRETLKLEGFDIAGINISSHQVGGDYYDFIKIEDGQTGIVIADVVGKGIPASLIMASFRASLIAEIRNNYAIRAIMQKVNRLMTESLDHGNFITGVYGVLDSKSKIFTYSNAGHYPPILVRESGAVEELDQGGLALGIEQNARFEERPIGLASGDILVFYTDGVTDAQNSAGDNFEADKLIEIVRQNREKPALEIVRQIAQAVGEFKAPEYVLDDLTLVILKVDRDK